VRAVEIGAGLLRKTVQILAKNGFPKEILVVADKNTLAACGGILEILTAGGFVIDCLLFEDLRTAHMQDVLRVTEKSGGKRGILSVGSGSLNDICRLAAFRSEKEFAIFATAPSMDGFASDSAPITDGNFKLSYPARMPGVIIADTNILAAAPAHLKSAGFGDMIGKYVALADWKISHLITGEYYCENMAGLTRNALERVMRCAPFITGSDPKTAGALMESLVMTGLAMTLAGCVRPASGAEHVLSHFWEIKKLEQGQLSDFHGKKVGVATLLITKLYKALTAQKDLSFKEEKIDWQAVYRAYGKAFEADIRRMNSPTVTAETTPRRVKENFEEIRRLVREELPSEEKLRALMKSAGAATTAEEIAVSPELCLSGLQYHPYMRHRMLLSRLVPMLSPNFDYTKIAKISDR
jgi:glycerol-1-phosphate dehydrogenase [NAD(P)+]